MLCVLEKDLVSSERASTHLASLGFAHTNFLPSQKRTTDMASSIILDIHPTRTSGAFPVRILPHKGYRQKSHGPSHAHISYICQGKDTAVGIQGSQG
jgi:hypothetical protein